MEFEEKAKVLREKLLEKKSQEGSESEKKQRMKKVLSARDQAMQSIYDIQDRTGIPSDKETEENFLKHETHDLD